MNIQAKKVECNNHEIVIPLCVIISELDPSSEVPFLLALRQESKPEGDLPALVEEVDTACSQDSRVLGAVDFG